MDVAPLNGEQNLFQIMNRLYNLQKMTLSSLARKPTVIITDWPLFSADMPVIDNYSKIAVSHQITQFTLFWINQPTYSCLLILSWDIKVIHSYTQIY